MIKKLYIKGFGRFVEREIVFEKGLNLVAGPNESGKSTIAAFIRAMLYGLPSRRGAAGTIPDRDRFRPWQGEGFGGSLVWVLEDGREILIERAFKEKAGRDILRVSDAVTGEELPKFIPVPGQALFSMEQDTFERTVFISQNGLFTRSNDEIATRLSNLVRSADEDVSLTAAIKTLDERRKYLYTQKGGAGRINRLTERLGELKGELLEAQERRSTEILALEQRAAVSEEIEQIKGEIARLKELMAVNRRMEEARRYNAIARAVAQKNELEKRICEIREEASADGFLPGRRWLLDGVAAKEAYRAALDDKRREEERLAEADAQIRATSERVASLGRAGADPTLFDTARALIDEEARLNAAAGQLTELKRREEELNREIDDNLHPDAEKLRGVDPGALTAPVKGGIGGRGAAVMAALSLVLGGGLWFLLKDINPTAALLAAGTGGLLVAAALILCNIRAGAVKKRKAELSALGVTSAAALLEKYEAFGRMEGRRAALMEQHRELLGEISMREQVKTALDDIRGRIKALCDEARCEGHDQLYIICAEARSLMARQELLKEQRDKSAAAALKAAEGAEALREELFLKLAPFSPQSDAEADALISRVEEALKSLDDYIMAYEKTKEHMAALAEGQDVASLKAAFDWARENEAPAAPPREELEERIERLGAALVQRNARLGELSAPFAPGPTPGEVEELIEGIKGGLIEDKVRLDAIMAARAAIIEAGEELSRTFAPRLCAAARAELSFISGKRHDAMQIDSACALRLKGEDSIYREVDFFSKGTIDQAYLAVRLALTGLLEGEERLPIILDDVFCQFDDDRMGRALKVLEKGAENGRQIILFSCHRREREILDEENVVFLTQL